VACACHPSYWGQNKIGDCDSGWLRQKARPYLQNNQRKIVGGVAQVVQHPPSKLEVLNLNLILPPQKKKKGMGTELFILIL
jgi:hypothetical protein